MEPPSHPSEVLIVTADLPLASQLNGWLASLGYHSSVVPECPGSDAQSIPKADLILFDAALGLNAPCAASPETGPPVVLLASSDELEDLFDRGSPPLYGYVLKPVDPRDLRAALQRAGAIRRIHDIRREQRRYRDALLAVSRFLLQASSLEEVGRQAPEIIHRALDWPLVMIEGLDETGTQLSLMGAAGLDDAHAPRFQTRSVDRTISGRAGKEGRVMVEPDLEGGPGDPDPDLRAWGARLVVSLPIRASDQAAGVLTLVNNRPGTPAPALIETLGLLADQLAQTFGRLKAEETVREREHRYRQVLDHAPTGILEVDQGGRIRSVNAAMHEYTSRTGDQLVGQLVQNLFDASSREPMAKRVQRVLAGEKLDEKTHFQVSAPEGSSRWVRLAASPIYEAGRITGASLVMHDVTPLLAIGEALIQSEANYRNIVENAGEGILLIRDGHILYLNPYGQRLFSRPAAQIFYRPFIDFVHPEDQPMIRALMEAQPAAHSFRVVDGKGGVHWVSTRCVEIEWNGQPTLLCFMTDVTAETEAVLALERGRNNLAALIENTDGMIWAVDPRYRLIVANTRFKAFTKEKMGHDLKDGDYLLHRNVPDELRGEWKTYYDRALAGTGFSVEVTGRLGLVDVTYEFTLHPIRSDQGAVAGLTVFGRDITEKKRTEEAIHASLKENRILLQEIHHRTKNNLQVISSLLNLQALRLKNEQALEAIRESQNRVMAMAMVHESLYQSESMANIELGRYIRGLAGGLAGTPTPSGGSPWIHVDIPTPVRVGLEQAVPCGLVLNELLTNALKHAYVDGTPGRILVRAFRDKDGAMRIEVQDDGRGLPEGFDWRSGGGLGLSLIRNLVLIQLRGEIDIDATAGTRITIRIP